MDGSLNIDWTTLSTMIGPEVQERMRQRLTPGQLQVLRETEVYVTQAGNQIRLEARFREDDENADQMVKGFLLNSLAGAMPQVAKVFGCRALFRKLKEDEQDDGAK
jgi:adenine-specific DNA methylase